jgi:hypothetical protein
MFDAIFQSTRSYYKTHPKTMSQIKEKVKTQSALKTYIDLNNADDEQMSMRDLKQGSNAKYNEKKKDPEKKSAGNLADQSLKVSCS